MSRHIKGQTRGSQRGIPFKPATRIKRSRGMDKPQGELALAWKYLPLFSLGAALKGKNLLPGNLLPPGSKLFPVRVAPISETFQILGR